MPEPTPPSPPPSERKDFWDKVTTLTVPFVTLVLGLLGAYATYTYNQASLTQQRTQAEREERQRAFEAAADRAQREQQGRSAKLLADADQLQKLFVYVASPDAQKREFGYWMFDALGQRDLALRLIALKRDKAGVELLRRTQSDPRPEVRAAATAELTQLLTPAQRGAVGTIIQRFEGGVPPSTVRRAGGDVLFGTNGWMVAGGGVDRVLDAYCATPGHAVTYLCNAGRKMVRPVSDDRFALLEAAAKDPAMATAEAAVARDEVDRYSGRASQIARDYDVRLPLSVAVLTDTSYWMGPSTARRLADQANAAAGGSVASGVDEKLWLRAYLAQRRERVEGKRSILPASTVDAMQQRNTYFDGMIAAGDWDMRAASTAARAPPPAKP